MHKAKKIELTTPYQTVPRKVKVTVIHALTITVRLAIGIAFSIWKFNNWKELHDRPNAKYIDWIISR